MEKDEEARMTICTAPPGLHAVVGNSAGGPGPDARRSIQVVTAFKYTYYGDNTEKIFSEPLVYCESKGMNALVDGDSRIEFVGSLENCMLKIKELVSIYYDGKSRKDIVKRAD